MNKKIKFIFPIPEKTHQQIKEESEQMGLSMSALINHILASHFNTKNQIMSNLTNVVEKALNEATKKNLK
jgi:iron-sulfur cluster repair protein YtfE (RIC family)